MITEYTDEIMLACWVAVIVSLFSSLIMWQRESRRQHREMQEFYREIMK